MPTTKQETLPKGVGVAKFDFTKTFRNQLFSRVRVLYHQYSITNHSQLKYFKVQNHEHFNDYFCCCLFYLICLEIFWSATVVHIQPWWQCIYLVQYYYHNHSSIRKVHLVSGHVVNVFWIDTVYVRNNLPTEFSKMTIFIIWRKIC